MQPSIYPHPVCNQQPTFLQAEGVCQCRLNTSTATSIPAHIPSDIQVCSSTSVKAGPQPATPQLCSSLMSERTSRTEQKQLHYNVHLDKEKTHSSALFTCHLDNEDGTKSLDVTELRTTCKGFLISQTGHLFTTQQDGRGIACVWAVDIALLTLIDTAMYPASLQIQSRMPSRLLVSSECIGSL